MIPVALNWLLNNWFSFISLIVALFGGIPGIVAVLKERKFRPQLAAYASDFVAFSYDLHGETIAGIYLRLKVGNKGKEPLVPLAFKLECEIAGKWIPFEAGAPNEGFVIKLASGEHKLTNVLENDLQRRRGSITRESPTEGFLLFLSKDVSIQELASIILRIPIKLVCIDLFQEPHEVLLNTDRRPTSQLLK